MSLWLWLSVKIFSPHLSTIVFAVSNLVFRFIVSNSSCIVSLLPELSGRGKTCVNHAEQKKTRERQGCLGMGLVTGASQVNVQVNGIIGYTTVLILLNCWVDYGYLSSRRGNCVMLC